ncbi:hydroxymethylglutaryl-CoA reductase (NADPH) [Thermocladium modestius]|uniref:3-hydroxy-3-methylglutaryl coenzyme A reductase n=1 Tax=Thermocladium modestius TaxID=62609 RepID=A0A830GU86_9CREN|nr:hydroxymethylglutaryl-CoA reductase (NADPH) [Thermocladium modestius]GGP21134.1 hydroxymethylglutaryl-CoA reductase (NADPH) [Thermocladium modestius]
MKGSINLEEEVLRKLINDEMRLHELDKALGDSNKATRLRRLYLERKLGIDLSSIGSSIIDFNSVIGHNAENTIGAIQVPVGVAGPLLIHGSQINGSVFVPLATTEGALIASVNRGAKVVTENGGASSFVLRNEMTRAPVFKLSNASSALEFIKWVEANVDAIKREAESTSKHVKLLRIDPFMAGNNVWLRFSFFTGDAMGMNMATIATDKAAKFIVSNFSDATLVALSGNMCVDKKASSVDFLLGRGKTVVSEAFIKLDYLKERLGLSPSDVVDVNNRKNLLGSAMSHSYGFNAHFANIVTAIFIATGQDVAQVVESSMGITWAEDRGNGLYFSVTLPSVEVGTVGGGTMLPTQREALRLLGVEGGGSPPGSNSVKFAEIVGAAVLAGELNLVLALARQELAAAHDMLGRAGRG